MRPRRPRVASPAGLLALDGAPRLAPRPTPGRALALASASRRRHRGAPFRRLGDLRARLHLRDRRSLRRAWGPPSRGGSRTSQVSPSSLPRSERALWLRARLAARPRRGDGGDPRAGLWRPGLGPMAARPIACGAPPRSRRRAGGHGLEEGPRLDPGAPHRAADHPERRTRPARLVPSSGAGPRMGPGLGWALGLAPFFLLQDPGLGPPGGRLAVARSEERPSRAAIGQQSGPE